MLRGCLSGAQERGLQQGQGGGNRGGFQYQRNFGNQNQGNMGGGGKGNMNNNMNANFNNRNGAPSGRQNAMTGQYNLSPGNMQMNQQGGGNMNQMQQQGGNMGGIPPKRMGIVEFHQ